MSDLAEYARAAFALDPAAPVALAPGGRGALGQVWRLDIGPRRYALKELFDSEAPAPALIAAEVDFTQRAATAGVRVVSSHPAARGGYVVPMPAGPGCLRLFDWLDARPVDLGADDLPARLGTVLGRLHRCAPRSDREPDGSPPDDWYDTPPAAAAWPPLVEAAVAEKAPWAADLATRIDLIGAITSLATPADPTAMITCHRDLHPENVLVDRDGELVVVDWDNLGPAEPGRELARLLLDWFFDAGVLAAGRARATLAAYRATGAPGRVAAAHGSSTEVFGLVIASRLNFLRRQIDVATEAGGEARHRDWAVREIDEALRLLPTPTVFAELTALDRALDRGTRSDQG